MKNSRLCRKERWGYTLLELIVSVGVLALLVVSATALFFSSIKGGNKVTVGTELKQNGQFAINTMEQMIRNSLRLVLCTESPNSSVQLVARDNKRLTFFCVDYDSGVADSGYIASASSELTSRLTSENVIAYPCSFACEVDPTENTAYVTVNFTLHQAGIDLSAGEDSAAVDFSTSVSLRSY